MNYCNSNMGCYDKTIDGSSKKSLAMAYVPWQEWKNVMCAKEGMEKGTIFSDLVLPFYGCKYRNRG